MKKVIKKYIKNKTNIKIMFIKHFKIYTLTSKKEI